MAMISMTDLSRSGLARFDGYVDDVDDDDVADGYVDVIVDVDEVDDVDLDDVSDVDGDDIDNVGDVELMTVMI